ncbi:unnamed protein product [Xylocopa violacea]|uniref:Mitochondrial inner membrane protease ATP23 n=1 Tax=Xylocopa violacea TaxID=135666 RepID=A0ABP1PD42_XYLVO
MTDQNNEKVVSEEQDETNAEYSDLYPGRRGPVKSDLIKQIFFYSQEEIQKKKCEYSIYNCVQNSPLVKLMLAALKSSGCEIDLSRHISCEVCDKTVTGGFDPFINQVVICQNTCNTKKQVQSTLSHELIHMFDYCRNKLDLNNMDHLACTEIRAANLCHCSFLGAVTRRLAGPFHIKQVHRDCVADKAIRSVMAIKNVSKDKATEAVQRVFTKCYNDLEPVGRRIRRKSMDMQKAYLEAPLYGYFD